MIRTCVVLATLSAWTASAGAQPPTSVREGPRALLPRGTEVALARSAAPDPVSRDATVLALTDTGYVVAERGTSGVTCYVGRSWRDSLEPQCFDAEGSATVLPAELERAALRQQGTSEAEIEREIARRLLAGDLRPPRRPAMSYMMSSGQVLYNDEGKHAGRWEPHLMIYYPNLRSEDIGWRGAASSEAALVFDEGGPFTSIVVVVRGFVDPKPANREGSTDAGGA
jgi:hypothetical protein